MILVKGVIIIKEFIYDLKENKFLKLYLILFSLINAVYVFFAGAKSYYIDKNSLGGTIEKHQFEYLSSISKITGLIEILIILILLGYLIKIIIKNKEDNLKHFLIIHFMLFVMLISLNYLVSLASPAYFWPSSQLLFIPIQISIIVLIYFAVTSSYKRLFRSSKA